VRILATATPCTGIAHIDKMLVMESSNVPTGWMSSSYLANHYDTGAGHINYLSVCDVPGEVEAEIKATLTLDNDTSIMRIAKRTRDDPCSFIWQLLAVDASVVGCVDASIVGGDATAPGGSHVRVTFTTTQTTALRCFWDISSDLISYYGKFVLLVVAQMEGATDKAKIKVYAQDESAWQYGHTLVEVSGTAWAVYDGWETFSFRIGTHDNDLFGAGNNWRIELFAETNGVPTDDLRIASVFLVPVDERYLIAGGAGAFGGGNTLMILKDMDGDRGMFAYGTGTDTYYPNLGGVGRYPLLTPEIENWLYFVSGGTYTLTDALHVALQYRPRGIFLRGSNP